MNMYDIYGELVNNSIGYPSLISNRKILIQDKPQGKLYYVIILNDNDFNIYNSNNYILAKNIKAENITEFLKLNMEIDYKDIKIKKTSVKSFLNEIKVKTKIGKNIKIKRNINLDDLEEDKS